MVEDFRLYDRSPEFPDLFFPDRSHGGQKPRFGSFVQVGNGKTDSPVLIPEGKGVEEVKNIPDPATLETGQTAGADHGTLVETRCQLEGP